MSLEDALQSWLISYLPISRLVGGRVLLAGQYDAAAASGEPAIWFERNDGGAVTHLGGRSSLKPDSVEIACRAKTHLDCRQLADAVRERMDSFRQRVVKDRNIRNAVLQIDPSSHFGANPAEERDRREITLSYSVWHWPAGDAATANEPAEAEAVNA